MYKSINNNNLILDRNKRQSSCSKAYVYAYAYIFFLWLLFCIISITFDTVTTAWIYGMAKLGSCIQWVGFIDCYWLTNWICCNRVDVYPKLKRPADKTFMPACVFTLCYKLTLFHTSCDCEASVTDSQKTKRLPLGLNVYKLCSTIGKSDGDWNTILFPALWMCTVVYYLFRIQQKTLVYCKQMYPFTWQPVFYTLYCYCA